MSKKRKRYNVKEDSPHAPGQRRTVNWLYGLHAVRAALENPDRRLLRLLATEDVASELPGDRIQPEIVDRGQIDEALPRGAVHQGVALLADPLPERSVEDVADRAAGLDRAVIVVLDQVTDPRNIGAILRSAAAFGALAVVVTERNAPETTAVLAKSASGAIETVPLVRVTNLSRALQTLAEAGFWSVGLDGDASKDLSQVDLTGRIAFVMGAEGKGLRRLTREQCDHLARIPMPGAMASLNVSNAAAIALYEATRSATDSP
jgi:23S rRNA (guanosine2251-2'-O)-methyltransferase